MAIYQQEEQTPSSLFDALYCEEDNWEDEEVIEENQSRVNENGVDVLGSALVLPILELQQDCCFEDEELITLFSKEQKQGISKHESCCDVSGRKQVVEWMLMANTHFGFSTLTSVLSVNYLDRFLTSFHLHKDKPWTLQLAAVTCLSLAAKVEETYVPLLLDLQIEGMQYMFQAKDVQKMELLVLSTLEWKMHPVTPLSFLDLFIRRLGLRHHLHWEFMRRCERLLLSLLPDWRFVGSLPSVLAAATMMHVIDQNEPCNALDYHNHLMGVLKINKEKVNDCYQLMKEVSSSATTSTGLEFNGNGEGSRKRKREQVMMIINGNTSSNNNSWQSRGGSTSPSGVIDASYIYLNNGDTFNDSWAATTTTSTTTNTTSNGNINNDDIAMSLSSSSLSSLSRKKGRVMRELQFPRVFFVDFIATP